MAAYPTQSGTPTYVINSTAGTACAPAIPSGMTANHLMVLAVSVFGDKTASISTPSGWTLIGTPTYRTSGATLALYYRVWQLGDTAPSVTWTTANKNVGAITPFLGCDLTTPIDTTVPAFATGSSTAATSPTGAATTSGACRLHIVSKAATGAFTQDSRMQEAVDRATSSSSTAALEACWETNMAAGATGTRTSTIGSTGWVAATVWLRPSSASAIAKLQSGRTIVTGGASTATVTLPNAGTAGSLLVCRVATWIGGTSGNKITDVDYAAGTNFTLADEDVGPSNNQHCSIWYYPNNTSTGTLSVVARRGGGSDDISMWVDEWAGADTSTPLDVHAFAEGTGATASVTTPTMSAGDRLLTNIVVADQGGTYGFDADYYPAYWYSNTADISIAAQDRGMAGGVADTATMGINTADWVSVIAAWKAAATGISGTASTTLDDIGAAGTGTLDIGGVATSTLASVAGSTAGALDISGATSATLDDITPTGAGTVAIQATASVALDDWAGAGTGTVGSTAIEGSAASTLDGVTSTAVGTVAIGGIGGSALGAVVGSASGGLLIQAGVSSTLDDTVGTGAGVVSLSGASSVTLDGVAGTSGGALSITASVAVTLDDWVVVSSGVIGSPPIMAVASVMLDSVSVGAVGEVSLGATASSTLDAALGVGRGTLSLSASASQTLADVVGAGSSGTLGIAAQAQGALDDWVGSGTGSLLVQAQAAHTLDDMVGVGASSLLIQATASVMLGEWTAVGSGAVSNGVYNQPPAVNSGTASLVVGSVGSAGVAGSAGSASIALSVGSVGVAADDDTVSIVWESVA